MTSKSFDSTEIYTFLQKHPEFFAEHSSLFNTLKLSNTQGTKVISFAERQIEYLQQENQRLQQDNQQLNHQLQTLFHNAQRSENIRQRIYHWACLLIQNPAWQSEPDTMACALADCFAIDYARIILAHDLKQPVLQSYTGPVQQAPINFELPHTLHSLAYTPLVAADDQASLGVLLVAATDQNHFTADMATDFLQHIAGLCAAALTRDK